MADVEDGDVVVGYIKLTKVLGADGTDSLKVKVEGLNIFETIGMLIAETDNQRDALRESFEPDE